MPFNITAIRDYIRVYYWGDEEIKDRSLHTNQLVTVGKVYKVYKFLIDTRDLGTLVEPIDFEKFSQIMHSNNLASATKLAILCNDSQLSMYSKFEFICMGLKGEIFQDNQMAKNWLLT